MQSKQHMKELVINLLKDNIPENYYYHNYKHTLYVHDTALEIAIHENCTANELDLISTAAFWHDTGYIKTYKNHEEESCNLARQYLPDYGYSADDIDIVCGMIMATKIPQSPKNKLEEILADADLEYMGTKSFDSTADDLFKEINSINPDLTEEKWIYTQISFLQNHHYFTRFCVENKEPVKQDYLLKLRNGIK
jgi:HD superfamily phosphodiesterase